MNDPIKTAVLSKAASAIAEIQNRLQEVANHLSNNEDLAALGTIAGLSARVQYVETLLTVLRDLKSAPPTTNPQA